MKHWDVFLTPGQQSISSVQLRYKYTCSSQDHIFKVQYISQYLTKHQVSDRGAISANYGLKNFLHFSQFIHTHSPFCSQRPRLNCSEDADNKKKKKTKQRKDRQERHFHITRKQSWDWFISWLQKRDLGSQLGHASVHLLSLAKVCIIQFTLVFQLSRRASLNFTLKFFSASSSDLPSAKESFRNVPETMQRYHLFESLL